MDNDLDTIDDKWELKNVSSLTILGLGTDYDSDGYSDVQEYNNYVNSVYDALFNEFNPTQANAPDGEGYVQPVTPPSGFINILPALELLLEEEQPVSN